MSGGRDPLCIRVKNLPPNLQKKARVQEYFSKFGDVCKCSRPQKTIGDWSVFVTFSSGEEATSAIKGAHGVRISGHRLSVINALKQKCQTSSNLSTNTLIITNLPDDCCNEIDLEDHFAQHGKITKIECFPKERRGLITYKSVDDAKHAKGKEDGYDGMNITYKSNGGNDEEKEDTLKKDVTNSKPKPKPPKPKPRPASAKVGQKQEKQKPKPKPPKPKQESVDPKPKQESGDPKPKPPKPKPAKPKPKQSTTKPKQSTTKPKPVSPISKQASPTPKPKHNPPKTDNSDKKEPDGAIYFSVDQPDCLDLPSKRHFHCAALVGSSMFVIGGKPDSTESSDEKLMLKRANVASASLGITCSSPYMTGLIPPERYAHICVVVGAKLYVFGGFCESSLLNDLFVFNTATCSWSQPSTGGISSAGRAYMSAVVYQYKIYIFGGITGNYTADLLVFDTETLLWEQPSTKGESPDPVIGHTANIIGDNMIVFGGRTKQKESQNDVFLLNLRSFRWSRLKSEGTAPSWRCGHSTILIKGTKLLIFGGSGAKVFDDFFLYDLEKKMWTHPDVRGNLPKSLWGHSCVNYNDEMLFFFGGRDGEKKLSRKLFSLAIEQEKHFGVGERTAINILSERPEIKVDAPDVYPSYGSQGVSGTEALQTEVLPDLEAETDDLSKLEPTTPKSGTPRSRARGVRPRRSRKPNERCGIYIKNLPDTVTQGALKNVCRRFGTIVNLTIPTKDGRSLGHAYLHFKDRASVQKAIGRRLVLGGNTLRIEALKAKARRHNLYRIRINDLPFSADEPQIYGSFQVYGGVKETFVSRNKLGLSQGWGYVTFDNQNSMEQALENSAIFDGNYVTVEKWGSHKSVDFDLMSTTSEGSTISTTNAASSFQGEAGVGFTEVTNALYICNINPTVTDLSLQEHFQDYGATNVKIVRNSRTGNSRGYGFVHFREDAHAQEALNKRNGSLLAGNAIQVEFRRERVHEDSNTELKVLFFWDIQITATKDQFRRFLIKFGALKEFNEYSTSKSGKTNWALVTFMNRSTINLVLARSKTLGIRFCGKRIAVKEHQTTVPKRKKVATLNERSLKSIPSDDDNRIKEWQDDLKRQHQEEVEALQAQVARAESEKEKILSQKKVVTEEVWEYRDETWHQYDPETSAKLSESFHGDKSIVKFTARNEQKYIVDLNTQNMFQQNILFKSTRDVRRTIIEKQQILEESEQKEYNYPDYWPADLDESHVEKVIPVPEGSDLYNDVAEIFALTCRNKIIRIDLLINTSNWNMYRSLKNTFAQTIGQDQVNERRLWHGTSHHVIKIIRVQGFIRDHNNVRLYGHGVYFARDASYPLTRGYASKDPDDGYRRVLLTRVAVGEYVKGENDLKRPPHKPHQENVEYETLVDSEDDPKIFVTTKDCQQYPEFMFTVAD